MKAVHRGARILIALFFVLAGANHFREPGIYLAMMPPGLPAKALLNVLSGAAELAGGIGLLVTATRRRAGWGLVALLIAVFPANVYVALRGHLDGFGFPAWVLWARLPFQLVFVAWVWWVSQPDAAPPPTLEEMGGTGGSGTKVRGPRRP